MTELYFAARRNLVRDGEGRLWRVDRDSGQREQMTLAYGQGGFIPEGTPPPMAPNAAHIVDFSEPAAPPAPTPTYEELLLAAARTLGREPSAQRIAEKAGLPLGKAGVIDQVNAAFHELISRGDLIPGTRGGLRLPERC